SEMLCRISTPPRTTPTSSNRIMSDGNGDRRFFSAYEWQGKRRLSPFLLQLPEEHDRHRGADASLVLELHAARSPHRAHVAAQPDGAPAAVAAPQPVANAAAGIHDPAGLD